MTYDCLEMNNPSRLRGLPQPADVISDVRVDNAAAYTIPQRIGWTKPATVYPLYFKVRGREKRAFIFMGYGPVTNQTKVIVGWPGSDGNTGSNGAMTMINPYNGLSNVNTWFANLVMAKDCVGLAIDNPAFGYNPYPGNYAPDPHSPMLDDLCAILAYKQAIIDNVAVFANQITQQPTNLILAGFSYGAIRCAHAASLMASVTGIPVDGVYIASGQLDKRIDTRIEFNPPDWMYENYNYKEMAINSPVAKMRWSFGTAIPPNHDYLYNPNTPMPNPQIGTTLDQLIALNPAKFSKYLHSGGHIPVYANIKSFVDGIWP